MGFTLLPAIDIVGGQVRAVGDNGGAPPHDPLDAALALQAAGAEWLHLVDLDAACGRGSNHDLIASIVGALDIDVEVAGGLVDGHTLDAALATGCRRVALSTAALADRSWCSAAIAEHGDRLAVSLDVRLVDGPVASAPHRLAARGDGTDVGALWETMAWLEAEGCGRFIVTDAGRDGTLSGFDIEFYSAVARATTVPVIASGGASTLDDLAALAAESLATRNLEGVIVGAALHTGRFTLQAALEAVRARERGLP
ncbi:MAG: bifunctional 1-(5-phosphoribosyl)-5-((5-phosphoribosylamino)methylideneamino)imidazole-4-carboxamide isomerase/phosphoribosylanthranilate isomerase PriA [Actinobacteria bacterium]|nr:bifunctional 1-(5-phosphoribosyl)-5-((5-phosphoribosylamino)methylideneamino)imidazole-4-carboxamide isomerase/phosphoribosylanthranilate isomerase PriA [Actinomycetota bacterium]